MSTQIGELSVVVSLDTKKLDADGAVMVRKLKAQSKQLDKEYAAMAGNAFGFSDFKGGGRGRRAGGGGSYATMMGGGAGGPAEKLARTFGGQTLGRLVGGGGEALAGLGPGAIFAAGVAGMAKLQMAVVGFAKESGKLDPATLSVINYGKALTGIGESVAGAAKSLAVEALGTLTRFGELIGSGFSLSKLTAGENSDAAAAGAEQRLAAFKAINDPARLGKSRAAIADFTRNQAFDAASPKGQQTILRGEIAALKTKEDQAKAEGRIADSLDMKLERLRKEAELQKNIADFTEKQRKNAEDITRQAAERRDAEDATRRKRFEEFSNQFDADFKAIEQGIYTKRLDDVRSRMGSMRNPFESGGASGFGSASAAGLQFVQAGNQIMNRMLEVLKAIEGNTEESLARL